MRKKYGQKQQIMVVTKMRKSKLYPTGFETFMILCIAVIVIIFGSWAVNIVQLTKCDFDVYKSNKCEIIHLIGVIPPIAPIVVWIDTGE